MEEKNLDLLVEVSGCPVTCLHCGVRGRPYKPMPLADIAYMLTQANEFCAQTGTEFGPGTPYPLHEVLHHPNAIEVIKLFNAYDAQASLVQGINTDGVSLALRDDWQAVLEAAKLLGTKLFFFAIHGVGEVHDRQVSRSGAYQALLLAVERVRTMGFRCECNVFLNKPNIPQFRQLVDTAGEMGMEKMYWDIAVPFPHPRTRRYDERFRPEIDELLPLAQEIGCLTAGDKEIWGDLENYTEAAFYAKAIHNEQAEAQEWVFDFKPGIVCRNNLDVHTGYPGLYGPCHGNLKVNGAMQVLQQAMNFPRLTLESFYFDTDYIPSPHEMAKQVGNPNGRKVYQQAALMRLRWLDLALKAYRNF